MTAQALLQTLAGRGVVLTAEAGRLRYRAPAGAVTPDLRLQLEWHKAALVALLSAQQTSLFDAPPVASTQDPHAARLVLTDFERARQRLAELEAELDAGAARLASLPERQWPAELVTQLNALAQEALKLAPVAEYFNLQDLETATGAAYQAVASNPTDPAALERYRRLDDAWAAVLGLPELAEVTP